MSKTQMNQSGFVSQPGQGRSYWVLGNLYTFKSVSQDTNGIYALIEKKMAMRSPVTLRNFSRHGCSVAA